MNRKIHSMNLLGLSVLGFGIMSASILFMPLQVGVFPGLLFWGGLLLGIACQWTLHKGVKQKAKKWGVFIFFTGKLGKIVDVALFLLLIVTTAALVLDGYSYMCYVLLAATVFAFSLHCIVNGKIFAFVASSSRDVSKANVNNKSDKKKGGREEK